MTTPIKASARLVLILAVVAEILFSARATLASHRAWRSSVVVDLAHMGGLRPLTAAVAAAVIVVMATRPKQPFGRLLMAAAGIGLLLAISAARGYLVLISLATLAAVVGAIRLWPELNNAQASRDGWKLLLAACLLSLPALLLQRPRGWMMLVTAAAMALGALAGLLGLALMARHAPLPSIGDQARAGALYLRHASSAASPFALMADKRHFWSSDRDAFLAYACRAGVALVLGPGIGAPAARDRLYEQFRGECRKRGWRLAFYQLPAADAGQLGRVRQVVGREAIVDLRDLSLEGPAMRKLRHDVCRGQRHGVSVQIQERADLSPETVSAMRRLGTEAAPRVGLGDMSFSVGSMDDWPAAPSTAGLAYDQEDRLVAYATWLWLPAARRVALDQLQRLPGSPPGATDLLLFTCMEQLAERADEASLGLAPTAWPGLGFFKAKFNPRWEPRYLATDGWLDLPAAVAAAFLLHFPRFEEALLDRIRSRPQMVWS